METSDASFPLRGDAPFAVHIRLTPQALAAIRAAGPSGTGQPQLRLDPADGRAVLTVGSQEFGFRAPPDQGCVIVRTDPSGSAAAAVVGRVEHRLKPLRSLNDAPPAQARIAQPVPATPLDVAVNFEELEAAEAAEAEEPAAPPRAAVLSPLIPASARAVAAARRGGLRLVLIALLSERSASLRGVRQALAAVAAEVPEFKQPGGKGELELALKAVATYKAPGTYVLKPGLEAEVQDLPGNAASDKTRAGDKRRRIDAEDMDVGPSPAARRASTPSLPSGVLTEDGSGGGGGGGGVSSRRAGSRALSSSSGRGSDSTDEPWVAYHAERLPQPPPALPDRAAYAAAAEEFNRRYESYFKLHQLLAANRRDFEALQAAADSAATPAERGAAEAEVERLWKRREARARRWEAAFRVLQAELTEWKAALGAFGQTRGAERSRAPVAAGGEEII